MEKEPLGIENIGKVEAALPLPEETPPEVVTDGGFSTDVLRKVAEAAEKMQPRELEYELRHEIKKDQTDDFAKMATPISQVLDSSLAKKHLEKSEKIPPEPKNFNQSVNTGGLPMAQQNFTYRQAVIKGFLAAMVLIFIGLCLLIIFK
jgi:hypothetical protein